MPNEWLILSPWEQQAKADAEFIVEELHKRIEGLEAGIKVAQGGSYRAIRDHEAYERELKNYLRRVKTERDAALDVCRSIVHRHDYPGTGIPEHELYEQALALLALEAAGLEWNMFQARR